MLFQGDHRGTPRRKTFYPGSPGSSSTMSAGKPGAVMSRSVGSSGRRRGQAGDDHLAVAHHLLRAFARHRTARGKAVANLPVQVVNRGVMAIAQEAARQLAPTFPSPINPVRIRPPGNR